jgi:WD40 repeat protein
VEELLVATVEGASGVAFGEAWSPTGDLLAIAGLDHNVRVWAAEASRELWATSTESLVSCVGWHPDGTTLLGGDSAGRVIVFDGSSGRVVHQALGHTAEVRSVACSSDGQRAASAGNDGVVRIWSVPAWTPVAVIPAHAGIVRSVAWSPGHKIVASGGHDCTVRVWDAQTGAAQGGLADHRSWVTSVAYSPDGRLLASASADSTVRVWDVASSTYLCVLDDFDGWWVENLCFCSDGIHLATIDQNGTIRIWDVHTGEQTRSFLAGSMNKSVSWSSDRRYIASGGPALEQIWSMSF